MANVAMLSTMADQEASQLAGAVSDLMPAGVILPYGGATAPAGWLLCDGAQISRTTYAKLFAAIGTAHGSGNGSSTFHLPDLRGRFLRGTDGGAARDPNRTTRTAANSGGATGDAVGSVQGNATAKNGLSNAASSVSGDTDIDHTHGSSSVSTQFYSNYDNFSGTGGEWYGATSAGNYNKTRSGTAAGQTYNVANRALSSGSASAQTISGDSETRPINANVNYIIKV